MENLTGVQDSGINNVTVSWTAPLDGNGVVDTSVTSYEASHQGTAPTVYVASATCFTTCSARFEALLYDPHTFSVVAINDSGRGDSLSVTVNVQDGSTPTPVTVDPPEAPRRPLTAAFDSLPGEHDGSPFTIALSFSEAVSTSYRTLGGGAITATNGSVTQARRNQGSSANWIISVTPSSAAERVTLTLTTRGACTTATAVCTSDGRALSQSVTRTINAATISVPAAVRSLQGSQDGSTNSITIRWNPPLRSGAVDATVTSYQAVRETYDTRRVATSACSNNGLGSCTVNFDSLTYDPHTVQVWAVNATGNGVRSAVTVDVRAPMTLTAALSNVPTAHSGTGTFRFKLTFSENIAVSYRTLRDSAFDVSGGEITRAQRAQRGSNLAWWITVRPNRYDDVDVTLRGGRACNVTGSICTSGGHQLQGTVSATIPIGQ